MAVAKVICPDCGQEISKSNFSKHQRRHQTHPETFEIPKYRVTHEGFECQFCGKTCKNSNSLRNHQRLCKQNPNKQQSGFVEYNKTHNAWNKGLTKETDDRVLKHSESLTKYYEGCDGPWKGHKHSDQTKVKIGLGVKKFLTENPDMVPYIRNHSSKESYPEEYFTELFIRENIKLIKQFAVGSYHLDFCDPNKKIDVEIDGDQHYLDTKIINHDKIRNEFLENNGWTIYRIRWSSYKVMTDKEKTHVINYIKQLLE